MLTSNVQSNKTNSSISEFPGVSQHVQCQIYEKNPTKNPQQAIEMAEKSRLPTTQLNESNNHQQDNNPSRINQEPAMP